MALRSAAATLAKRAALAAAPQVRIMYVMVNFVGGDWGYEWLRPGKDSCLGASAGSII